jgi:hypothetical protein
MRSTHKAVDGPAGCGQIVGKSAGRGQKKLERVRVAHKVVDHGVAPERDSVREAYTKKQSIL